MSFRISQTIFTCLFYMSVMEFAHANECLPQQFRDVVQSSSDIYLKYHLNSKLLRNYSENKDTKVGISIYDIVGLNYDQASKINEFVRSSEQIDVNYSDAETFMQSQMTDNELAAYIACISSSDPITFATSKGPSINSLLALTVKYNPSGNNDPVKVVMDSVANAELTADPDRKKYSSSVSMKSFAHSDSTFFIKRDVEKPTSIKITVNDKGVKLTKDFYIPAAPKYQYVIDAVSPTEYFVDGQATGPVGWHALSTYAKHVLTSCIVVDKDRAYIIPNSVRANWSMKVAWGGEFDENITYDGHNRACVSETVNYTVVGNGEHLEGDFLATGTALIAKPLKYEGGVAAPQ